ncbi:MAG: HAD family hydrolase [Bacteroidales bacterium]
MNIRNIIFDLGGVLLNIDYQATINAFKKLGMKDFDEFFTQAAQHQLFDRLDKGEVSPPAFREELRRLSGLEVSDEEIDSAWNAMLLDLPAKRLALLERVGKRYRTFLLSNTNSIHYPAYMDYLNRHYGIADLSDLFNKQYLSFQVGMRKPDRDIFRHVLSDQALQAGETLFIDDSVQHVKGAREAGLNAVWLDVQHREVNDLFTEHYRLREETKDMVKA